MKNAKINKSLKLFLLIFLVVFTFTCQVNNQQKKTNLYQEYDNSFKQYLNNTVNTLGKESIKLEDLSDKYTVPKKLTVSGDPYDLGFTIGDIARQFNFNVPQRSDENEALQNGIIDMYKKIYPNYLAILKGIAEANGLKIEDLDLIQMEYEFFVQFWTQLLQYQKFLSLTDFGKYGDGSSGNNCSVATYYIDKIQLIGRNLDNPSERPHYFIKSKIDGAFKSMGHSMYTVQHWAIDGINEKGLSINCATNLGIYNWQEPYPDKPAVYAGHMARIVLDTCSTVDEAVNLIGSVRIWFPDEGLHWTIADRTGKSIIVEFNLNREMVVFDNEGPYELMTNTAFQEGEEYVENNCPRYRAAKPLLEAGVFNKDEMFEVMQSMRVQAGGSRTLWTSIMDLKNLTIDVYYRKEYDRKFSFSF